MLPRSKLSSGARSARRIKDRSGRDVEIGFEAVWNRSAVKLPHLRAFVTYLREVVPAVAQGVAIPFPGHGTKDGSKARRRTSAESGAAA
jgi:hypothetical protein